MINFLKTLIAQRVVIKIFALIFALGVFPIIIFLYELHEEPTWIKKDKYYLRQDFVLTVKSPLKLFNTQANEQALRKKAEEKFKEELYKRALKQIKLSYNWSILNKKIQTILMRTLKDKINKIKLNNIKKQSIYESNFNFQIYGLFSMKNSDIDVILQGIYEDINKKMLRMVL